MQLATGVVTIEDFETGEHIEKLWVVYETKTRSKMLEVLEWFAKSKYKKLLVVPDSIYKSGASLRGAFSERMGYFIQPDDCFVSVVQEKNRVFLEKT